jgi:apolipoprotein N-acyltransferase
MMSTSTQISTNTRSFDLKTLYLLLAIAGSIAPWFWLLQDPTAILSPTLFCQRAFVNNVATAISSDILISATTFFCWAGVELKRLGSNPAWVTVYIGLTFGIGLSCALPLFLYRRELILERQNTRG